MTTTHKFLPQWIKSNTNTTAWLSLDNCRKDQFNCDDGTCIDLQRKCDFNFDCLDETDESHCSRIIPNLSYNKIITPLGNQSKLEFKELTFILYKIDDVSSRLEIQFMVNVSWKDHRLTFADLNPETSISPTDQQQMWLPEFAGYLTTQQNIVPDTRGGNL